MNTSDNPKILVVYCLEFDESSILLRYPTIWVYKLSKSFERVIVFTIKKGELDHKPSNIQVIEIGGGSTIKRLKGVYRLTLGFFRIISSSKGEEISVFHYMSPRTAVYPGLLFKLARRRQTLWYAHPSTPLSLNVGFRIVQQLVTTSKGTISNKFPLKKIVFTGNGVDEELFVNHDVSREETLLTVSRVSRSKNLEQMFMVAKLANLTAVKVIGPILDLNYKEELETAAKIHKINCVFTGPLNHEEIVIQLNRSKFFYSGMIGSVDKSALEAGLCGCLIVANYEETLIATGMKKALSNFGADTVNIESQVRNLLSLKEHDLARIRIEVRNHILKEHSLNSTMQKLTLILSL